jgi:hypothetical protein
MQDYCTLLRVADVLKEGGRVRWPRPPASLILAAADRSMICNTDVVDVVGLGNLVGEAAAVCSAPTSPKATMGTPQPYDPGSAPSRRSRPSPLRALAGRNANVSRDIAR